MSGATDINKWVLCAAARRSGAHVAGVRKRDGAKEVPLIARKPADLNRIRQRVQVIQRVGLQINQRLLEVVLQGAPKLRRQKVDLDELLGDLLLEHRAVAEL